MGSTSTARPEAKEEGCCGPPAPSSPTAPAKANAAAAPAHPPSLPRSTSAADTPPSATPATAAAAGSDSAAAALAVDAARTPNSATEAVATERSSELRARVERVGGGHPKHPTPASRSSTTAPSTPRHGARLSPRASGTVSTTVAISPNRRARSVNAPPPNGVGAAPWRRSSPPSTPCPWPGSRSRPLGEPRSGSRAGRPRGLNGPHPGSLPSEP